MMWRLSLVEVVQIFLIRRSIFYAHEKFRDGGLLQENIPTSVEDKVDIFIYVVNHTRDLE
jgi:hypothetical protein